MAAICQPPRFFVCDVLLGRKREADVNSRRSRFLVGTSLPLSRAPVNGRILNPLPPVDPAAVHPVRVEVHLLEASSRHQGPALQAGPSVRYKLSQFRRAQVAVDVAGLAVKRDPPAYTDSERETKRELYQSRLVRLCGDTTQIGLRRCGDLRVGHSELGSIEQVERLGAKRQIHAAADCRRFRHGEVPVVHVVSP